MSTPYSDLTEHFFNQVTLTPMSRQEVKDMLDEIKVMVDKDPRHYYNDNSD